MKTYIYLTVLAAFLIYIGSAVINQYGDAWNDWGYVVSGFWNFHICFGLYHFYRQTKYTHFMVDVLWLTTIGYTALGLIHSAWIMLVWTFTGSDVREILSMAFEQYNLCSCMISGSIVIGSAVVYLMNFGNIWRSIWK